MVTKYATNKKRNAENKGAQLIRAVKCELYTVTSATKFESVIAVNMFDANDCLIKLNETK